MQRFIDLNPVEQSEIFSLVKKLKKQGLGYKRIIKKIGTEQKVKLQLSTLSYWFNNEVTLLGGENWFEEKPSKELSYLIGVMFGDGSIIYNAKKQEYVIQLEAIDKDFVEKFSHCISIVLKKDKDYPVWQNTRGPIYSTHVRSKQLYYFFKSLKEEFSRAKPFIEEFPAEFIQGLADSEGCPKLRATNRFSCGVTVANSTNLSLLEYTKDLLKTYFLINSTIHLSKKAGIIDSIIGGRKIKRTKDLFVLNINSMPNTRLFFEKIDFSIQRKKEKLSDAIAIMSSIKPKNRRLEWEKIYRKERRNWIKNRNDK